MASTSPSSSGGGGGGARAAGCGESGDAALPLPSPPAHSAAASDGLPERVAAIFAANLGRWVRGEPLRNLAGR